MDKKTVEVAVGVIIRNNKILLTQRNAPHDKSIHLCWQLPGGAVEKGETLQEACLREVLEETGFKVKLTSAEPYTLSHPYRGKIYILNGFRAEIVSGTISTITDEETADAKWYSLHQIVKLRTLEDTLELVSGVIAKNG